MSKTAYLSRKTDIMKGIKDAPGGADNTPRAGQHTGGVDVQTIPLTRGFVAIVDDEDYAELSRWTWCPQVGGQNIYAIRSDYETGQRLTVSMHRQVLGLGMDSGRKVDHINQNTLDNRKANLRACTHAQNIRNSRKRSGTVSKYRGVTWAKDRKMWRASTTMNGKKYMLGQFGSEEAAARAYDTFARKHYGAFVQLNFPDSKGESM